MTMTTSDFMTYGSTIDFTPLHARSMVVLRYQGLTCKAIVTSISKCGQWATFAINLAGNLWVEHSYSRAAIGAKYLMGTPVLLMVRDGLRWNDVNYSAVIA